MSPEAIEAMRQLTMQLKKMQPSMSLSNAPQVLISIVPILGVVMGTTLLFFFLLWKYRINRELVQTGQYQPSFWNNLRTLTLLIGSLSFSIGLPLSILFFAVDGVSYTALGGLIPLFTGIGFIMFYVISIREQQNK